MVRIWDLVDKYMLVVSVFIAFKGNLIKKKNLVKKTWKTWKNKQTLPATAFKFLEVFAALFYFLNRYDLAQQSFSSNCTPNNLHTLPHVRWNMEPLLSGYDKIFCITSLCFVGGSVVTNICSSSVRESLKGIRLKILS